MNFTRYFIVSPRPELIELIARVDADGAEVLEGKQVWSVDFSFRAVPGNVDAVLSTTIKFAYLLHVSADYGLGDTSDSAFHDVLRTAINWPKLSTESFDRNWELSFTDEGVVRLEDFNHETIGVLKSVSFELPNQLTIREKEHVSSWIGKLTKEGPQCG